MQDLFWSRQQLNLIWRNKRNPLGAYSRQSLQLTLSARNSRTSFLMRATSLWFLAELSFTYKTSTKSKTTTSSIRKESHLSPSIAILKIAISPSVSSLCSRMVNTTLLERNKELKETSVRIPTENLSLSLIQASGESQKYTSSKTPHKLSEKITSNKLSY